MDRDVVQEAIERLQGQGEQISIRAVHKLVGGSFRDLSRLLREAKLVSEEEVSELEAVELAPPAPTQIQLARRAVEVAQASFEEAQMILDRTTDRLRALQRDRPHPTTDPTLVSETVAAQVEHALQVGLVQEEVKALGGIVAQLRAERDALKADEQRLRERAHDLRANRLPSVQHELREARRAHEARVREAEHAVRMAAEQVHGLDRTVAAVEAELRRLVGAS